MSKLLVISSAPAAVIDGNPFLDIKFCEGMNFYATAWEGEVSGLLRTQDNPFPFGRAFAPTELSFTPILLDVSTPIDKSTLAEFDIVLCSGDNHRYLDLWKSCEDLHTKVVYIIEYDLKTRFQIIGLNKERGWPRKLSSLFWTLFQERRRKTAFKRADGLQANGYPAKLSYGPLCQNSMIYLDNRLKPNMMATPDEMAERKKRAKLGPLRLVNSGRLEAMKGAQDLIPIAVALSQKQVDFHLDIFGTGSLEGEIREGISRFGLADHVTLHAPVDFETELVPYVRAAADIFLSCHRQGDPSCTYLESMGCGIPVVGYENNMLHPLVRDSGGGWTVPLGDHAALADRIAQLADAPDEVTACAASALDFTARHTFDIEFRNRVAHLQSVLAQ